MTYYKFHNVNFSFNYTGVVGTDNIEYHNGKPFISNSWNVLVLNNECVYVWVCMNQTNTNSDNNKRLIFIDVKGGYV